MKKYLVGTVTLDRDTEMTNTSFQYATSFETLLVKAGTYPIYVYADDIRRGRLGRVARSVLIDYTGEVLAGNVGKKIGSISDYFQCWYGYEMADAFLKGRPGLTTNKWYDYHFAIRPEWTVQVADFVSDFENSRIMCLELLLKDGAEPVEMREGVE